MHREAKLNLRHLPREVCVLHGAQKKTQATSRQDKTIAETCYRAVAKMRKAEE